MNFKVHFYPFRIYLLIFSPSRIVGRSIIQKDDLKLQVNRQATTETSQKISKSDLATLKEKVRNTYPNVKSKDIELEGDTPFRHVDDSPYVGEFTVYGKVIGITLNETSRENTVAVLKVSYWDMPMFQYLFYENSIVRLSFIILLSIVVIARCVLFLCPKKGGNR
ncbi:transposase [Bacillus toyonensis]|uniref:transposase n=1 Tax=Bacillus TaxID=1386 RepID=UPI000BFCFE5F|nr:MULTISPECIES: transposase [Bacillus]MBY7137063.1 transposase [Bacillus sp. 12RED03]MCU5582992.1 transposase [Bacillus toyonensis]PHA96455.1 transposase [Bacillus toyonensis]